MNLFGTVLPTMVFAEIMVEQKKGSIVNFCSESALRPLTTETIERSMSKNCLRTVSQRTIRVCQQRTVLVSQELYGTIHYLISDASNFVTGTVAVIDGGFDAFSI